MGEDDSGHRQDSQIETEKEKKDAELEEKKGSLEGEIEKIDVGVEYEAG
jgi:hypothetical protein